MTTAKKTTKKTTTTTTTTSPEVKKQALEKLANDVQSFRLPDADRDGCQKLSSGNGWEIEFSADKNGCDYYEPRDVYECNDGLDEDDEDFDPDADQDDDFPNFVGDAIVEREVKAHFGNDVTCEVQDQEKGYFSVYVYLKEK